jgi:hypothetical protein
MFDNRKQKILEGSLEGRRQAGKPRNRWEDQVLKDVAKLVNTRNRCTAENIKSDCRKTTGEVTDRIRSEVE